jgi:twinkle protein
MKTTNKTNLPCPDTENCGSSDAFSIQENGWGHCFSCGNNFPPGSETQVSKSKKTKRGLTPVTDVFRPFTERGFTEETVKRYKIHVAKEGDDFVAKYPLFDTENNHVANKVRLAEKGFTQEGQPQKAGLFGRHAFEPGSAKAITVVEGQDDAPAAYQIMGSKYPVVSVHSASSAIHDIQTDFEYLNSFETIVFAFDNDDAGRKAAKAAAGCGFPLGKVKLLTLRRHKDANDYLKAKESEQFSKEWWQAPTWKPDGLKLGSDMWSEIIDRKEHFTVLYPFEGVNKLTFGLRLSEMTIITADTGVGKTALIKAIEHKLLTDEEVKEKNYGVGFLHLEEPNGDTALGLLSVHNGVPYHIPGVERPQSELRKAYDELLNNNRVVIWDHFGSNSVDAVVAKIRHMAALGCKYIVIDHLSIIVSDQAGDERKQLDEIATKVKTLAMEQDLCIIAVIHTNRQGQIRGTAGVEQLANIVIRLERDKTEDNEWRRNITKVTVEKNRFTGYTGPASYLWYNKETGRLLELDPEDVDVYVNGGAVSDDRQGF